MGWEELTLELVGSRDVREAIQWAEAAQASDEGPASRRGRAVQARTYVIYARLQSEDRWVQVAGWPPVLRSDWLPPDWCIESQPRRPRQAELGRCFGVSS